MTGMTSPGRGRPRLTTRNNIRDTALQLFQNRGYDHTTLAQVAEAAGISRTTLFSHFPSKQAIVWDLHNELLSRARASIPELEAADPTEFLVSAISSYTAYPIEDHGALARLWTIAQQSAELRQAVPTSTEELAELVLAEAFRRYPQSSPEAIEHVTFALIGVTSRCVRRWAQSESVDCDLHTYTQGVLRPIAQALMPLIQAPTPS